MLVSHVVRLLCPVDFEQRFCGAHPLVEAPGQGFQLVLQGSVLLLHLIRIPHRPVVVAAGVPAQACSLTTHVSETECTVDLAD